MDTVVDNLVKDPKRHFIYVETGFFARWWDEQNDARRNVTRALVKNGQLEFINGAWCMHDEASPFLELRGGVVVGSVHPHQRTRASATPLLATLSTVVPQPRVSDRPGGDAQTPPPH